MAHMRLYRLSRNEPGVRISKQTAHDTFEVDPLYDTNCRTHLRFVFAARRFYNAYPSRVAEDLPVPTFELRVG